MSMQGDAEVEEKIEISTVTVDEFKKITQEFVTKLFWTILKGVRTGGLKGLKKENTLALTRTVLGCDLTKEVVAVEGTSFQDNQRDALSLICKDFASQDFHALLSDRSQIEKC